MNAAPTEDVTTPANTIEDTLKNAAETIGKSFNDARPKLEEWFQKGQEILSNIGLKITDQADKMMNKEPAAA